MKSEKSINGYMLGILAYISWGLYPIYFKSLNYLSATEIMIQRLLWSAVFGCILLFIYKNKNWINVLISKPYCLAYLALTGILIAGGWFTYVWSVNNGYILDASLGYYVTPLVNVLLGAIFLKERMSFLKWVAVIFASAGVILQSTLVGHFPWISLVLAFSFGVYGLIRKKVPVDALPGLVIETLILVPFALAWLYVHPGFVNTPPGFFITGEGVWLMMAGPVTLLPLLWFNAAARKIPYSTLGFLQYIAPTLVLIEAVFLYNEELGSSEIFSFCFIWIAIIIYTVDVVNKIRKEK